MILYENRGTFTMFNKNLKTPVVKIMMFDNKFKKKLLSQKGGTKWQKK